MFPVDRNCTPLGTCVCRTHFGVRSVALDSARVHVCRLLDGKLTRPKTQDSQLGRLICAAKRSVRKFFVLRLVSTRRKQEGPVETHTRPSGEGTQTADDALN